MPILMTTLNDRAEIARSTKSKRDTSLSALSAAPANAWVSIFRGVRGRCPRCGQAKLFRRFLKPAACEHCYADWTGARADDFPAYISILVSGHILAPIIIAFASDPRLSTGLLMAIIPTSAALLAVGLLQPAKGAVIALQWWLALSSVKREPIADPTIHRADDVSVTDRP